MLTLLAIGGFLVCMSLLDNHATQHGRIADVIAIPFFLIAAVGTIKWVAIAIFYLVANGGIELFWAWL